MGESGVAGGLETHEGPPHPHQEVGCPLPPVPHRPHPWLWFGSGRLFVKAKERRMLGNRCVCVSFQISAPDL